MNGFLNLYEAIWKQAVEEDTQKYRFELKKDIALKIFPDIVKQDSGRFFTEDALKNAITKYYGKQNEDTLKIISLKIEQSDFQKAVKWKVHREASIWPSSPGTDKQFFSHYHKLKSMIADELKSMNCMVI